MDVSICTNAEATPAFAFLLSPPASVFCSLLCIPVALCFILWTSFLLPPSSQKVRSASFSHQCAVWTASSPLLAIIVVCLCGPLSEAYPPRIGCSHGYSLTDLCCGWSPDLLSETTYDSLTTPIIPGSSGPPTSTLFEIPVWTIISPFLGHYPLRI